EMRKHMNILYKLLFASLGFLLVICLNGIGKELVDYSILYLPPLMILSILKVLDWIKKVSKKRETGEGVLYAYLFGGIFIGGIVIGTIQIV
ncbi:MAG: hypothetical protein RR425_06120, partial [Erysipelotrichales bacterium]